MQKLVCYQVKRIMYKNLQSISLKKNTISKPFDKISSKIEKKYSENLSTTGLILVFVSYYCRENKPSKSVMAGLVH